MAFLRRFWFQIHWFIGITAGSVLVVIGLSGAVLSFRAEIVDAINPELRHISNPAGGPALRPAALAAQVQAAHPARRIAALTVFAEPGRPARVNFAPPEGQRQGEVRLIDPWTGALLPVPTGDAFFEFAEHLHRWLLLPRDAGKPVTGTLAVGLLVLALSGLYLRWPRRPLAWRAWLKLDFALTGRAFLWNLHAVAGTLALLVYLVSSLTGIYWAFDAVRTVVDNAAGEGRVVRAQGMQAGSAPAKAPAAADLQRVWQSFLDETAGDWSLATLRLPARNASQVEVTYLRAHPEHERARNRLHLDAATGEPTRHQRYADKPLASRLVNSIYPMHMGTYWGLPGRIVMLLSSLGLALFAVTGWMLYLGRRRTKRAVREERMRLGPALRPEGPGAEPVLLTFASQTGQAERIALQTAAVLQSAGVAVVLQPLVRLSVDALRRYRKVLLVASTFGDGDPPDSLRAFARQFALQTGSGLQHVRYGLLALGDRHYANFCGFGRSLDHDLRGHGAEALFPMIEVHNGDAGALARWQHALAEAFGVLQPGAWKSHEPKAASFEPWRLVRRTLLNAGSQGDPLFEIEIELAHAGPAAWVPGALVELLPRQSGHAVGQFLRRAGLDGRTHVRCDGRECTLEDALSRSMLPAAPAASAQALADMLVPLAPRRYSVASIAADGCVQLLVRQARHADGMGVASGWLTEGAPLDAEVELRLLSNPAFALVDDESPCVFIGNGSGFAGLRAHLRERVRRGHGRNWLVFGERNAAHDAFCAEEIAQWQAAAALERVDLVFSRDQAERLYVQHRLREAADLLRQWVAEGAAVYVCGSLDGMAPGVDLALREVLGAPAYDALVAEGRYRRDVY